MLNHDEILELCDRYFPGLTFKHSEPHHTNQLYRAVIECNDIDFSLYVTDKCAIVEVYQSGRVILMRSPKEQGITVEQALADIRRQWDKYLHQMFKAIEPTGGVQ